MLKLILALALVVVATAAPNFQSKPSKIQDTILRFEPENVIEKLWDAFKSKHEKSYESDEEESKRKDIFAANVKKVDMHNYLHDKGYKSYRLGLNEYADLEPKEFFSMMNGYKMNKGKTLGSTYLSPMVNFTLPDSVDWRTKGAVTDVKNQGNCGSCWSFSTTGSLEGQHFRKSGKLVSLSEQNLVDCSGKYGNMGCNGGLMDNAFQYIKDNNGIDTEESYPYTAAQGECQFSPDNVGATVTGFKDLPQGDESSLKEAVASVGPISIAIDASHQSFQLYQSGVYDEPECSSTQLDHGVLIVGYGTMDGSDYWIVKNSWGPTWGQQGYVFMSRNKDNQCGVATSASYPLV